MPVFNMPEPAMTYVGPDGEIGYYNATQVQALVDRINELEADAARYRWLRDMDENSTLSLAAIFTDCNGSAISISNRIDSAVDAKMKESL